MQLLRLFRLNTACSGRVEPYFMGFASYQLMPEGIFIHAKSLPPGCFYKLTFIQEGTVQTRKCNHLERDRVIRIIAH